MNFSLYKLDSFRKQEEDLISLREEFQSIKEYVEFENLHDISNDNNEWIQTIISGIGDKIVDYEILVNFYRVLMYYGFFQSAWEFRKRILCRNFKIKDFNSFLQKLIENNHLGIIRRILNFLSRIRLVWKFRNNPSLKLLRMRMKTRSNLIIGPAQEDLSYINLSKYDNIHEIKKIKIGKTLDSSQNNIIWFNHQHSNGELIKSTAALKKDNTLLISKGESAYSDVNFPRINPFWIGSPMMLQNIIQILDICGSKIIDVSGFNLYISSQPYSPEYPVENISLLTDVYSRRISIALHDPFSNFLYLKNLYRSHSIRPLGELKHVLDLEVSEYINKLKLAN